MKTLDIVCPTRNRLAKLRRMLATLPEGLPDRQIITTVIADGDSRTAAAMLEDPRVDRLLFVRGVHGSVFCRNLAAQVAEGALLYITDDIEFEPGAIEVACRSLEIRFPDEDGVIGFVQVNAPSFSPAGVALVGQKFLKRYPNRKLFFPGYIHFCCQEIERLAQETHRLFLCPEAQLVHHHPSFEPAESDLTHLEARKHRDQDKRLSTERRQRKQTWGAK